MPLKRLHWFAFLTIASLLGMAGQAQAGTDSYSLVDVIPYSADGNSWAVSINNNGQIAGISYYNTVSRAILWQNGVPQNLGNFGPAQAYATCVNDLTEVVGWAYTNFHRSDQTVIYDGFIWTPTKPLIGFILNNNSLVDGIAYSVNNKGEIVGFADGIPAGAGFLYANGQTTGLPGAAYSINDQSQIVGEMPYSDESVSDSAHAYLSSNGSITDLGTLPGDSHSIAFDINELGQIVGESDMHYDSARGFLYDPQANPPMINLGGADSMAYAINDDGQIVGISNGHACTWQNGVLYDLNDLIPANSGMELLQANDINAQGQIIGRAALLDGSNQEHGFLLNPAALTVNITLKNWDGSSVPISSLPVKISINGDPPTTHHLTGTGSSGTLTLRGPRYPRSGTYTMTVKPKGFLAQTLTLTGGDGQPLNFNGTDGAGLLGGDVNDDGTVDDFDLTYIILDFLSASGSNSGYGMTDTNGDGKVDDFDLTTVITNFLLTSS